MKNVIINEEQLRDIIREMRLEGYDYEKLNAVLRKGYLIHGGELEFDTFNPDMIRGGSRGVYGYGMYFTDEAYKALEYGQSIVMTKKDIYNLWDLDGNYDGFIRRTVDIKDMIEKWEHRLDNCRNIREWDECEAEIEKLKSETPKLNMYEDIVQTKFMQALRKYKHRNMEDLYKWVLGGLPENLSRHVSSYLLKMGYDGVKCGNQYVIFNFDKLNRNLFK